jgi:hypothetical protein
MTLSDLRASARSKADEQATGFITDTELDRFLNQGYRFVYGKIVQAFESFFLTKGTLANGGLISVSSATQNYSLPTTMLKLVMAEWRESNSTDDNSWKKLTRLNIGNNTANDYYPVRDGRDQGVGYFVTGTEIMLRPVPAASWSLRLWFIPRATALSQTTDTPDVPVEYQELIAEYAAIQCLAKSGEGIWKERQDTFNLELQNLLDTIAHRVQEPEQMLITDNSDSDCWSW